MPQWVRIKDLSPYVGSGDISPTEEDFSLSRRFYAEEGKEYPIFNISIYPNLHYREKLTGFKISSSYKSEQGQWWADYVDCTYISFDLIPELLEMIEEVKEKL